VFEESRRLRQVAALILLLVLPAVVLASRPKAAQRKATANKPKTSQARKSSAHAKTAAKPGVRKTSGKTARGKARRSRRAKASWRTGRMQPTPDRYAQIQQALIDKGYLRGSATGVWGPESVDALKRFQQDQKLEPDGKITALSLIALGLGPRTEPNLRKPSPDRAVADPPEEPNP
jgi:peptidoglycan hydrolase-like protein with peptidoglycan-binding domain